MLNELKPAEWIVRYPAGTTSYETRLMYVCLCAHTVYVLTCIIHMCHALRLECAVMNLKSMFLYVLRTAGVKTCRPRPFFSRERIEVTHVLVPAWRLLSLFSNRPMIPPHSLAH